MQVAENLAVAIEYTLTIDGGIVVDASPKGQPLWYLHGHGNLIPGLERALIGLSVGTDVTVVVEPADGYGERQPERVQRVPKDRFGEDSTLSLGDRVVAQSPDGQEIPARVKAVGRDDVTLDFNHELAGKTLTFAVRIAEVRPASRDELRAKQVQTT